MKMNAIHLRLCCLGLLLLPTWPLLGPSTAAAQPAGLRYDDGYVYLAATQAASHFLHCTNYSFLYRLQIFMFFALGVVGIGLVLLDHEHCTASAGDGGGHGLR